MKNSRVLKFVGYLLLFAVGFMQCRAALGQFANSSVWSMPGVTYQSSDMALTPPIPDDTTGEVRPGVRMFGSAPVRVYPGEAFVAVAASARAAVVEDSTRINPFSKGAFLPSAIPVNGDPFFGSDSRSSVQGSGSSLDLLGGVVAPNSEKLMVGTRLIVQDASLGFNGIDASGTQPNVTIQQAYASYNGLLVGSLDTAISDTEALPEILDLAGPNARVTVLQNGFGAGQGRLSYTLLRPEADGLAINLSIENPSPEINRPQGAGPGGKFDTFARYPDFLVATRYGEGKCCGGKYIEDWHIQFGSVVRSLGLENDNGTFEQQEFGWGTVLSGAYRLTVDPDLSQRDGLFGSIAYGEGFAHYIVDLRQESATLNNNDAAVDAAGELQALPALAWYVAYMHNWSECLRSTVTYSEVTLDSIATPTQTLSPYRRGQFAQVNLVYHSSFKLGGEKPDAEPHLFFTGLEWTFGEKEELSGASGDANRLMWLVAFKK